MRQPWEHYYLDNKVPDGDFHIDFTTMATVSSPVTLKFTAVDFLAKVDEPESHDPPETRTPVQERVDAVIQDLGKRLVGNQDLKRLDRAVETAKAPTQGKERSDDALRGISNTRPMRMPGGIF